MCSTMVPAVRRELVSCHHGNMRRGSSKSKLLSIQHHLRLRLLRLLLVLIVLLSSISAGTCASLRMPPLQMPSIVAERKQPAARGDADAAPVARRRGSGAGRHRPLHLATAVASSPFLARPNDDVAVLALRAEQNNGEGSNGSSSHIVQTITSKAVSLMISFYGVALLLRGLPTFSAQVHVLTMMRASGARKIERAMRKARQNFRDAYWAAVRNSPSLYYANRSIQRINSRVATARALLAETKRAKQDGVMTPAEERRLARMRRRYIRRLKGDARRLRRAKTSMGRILTALDLNGTWDIMKEIVVTLSTVMATGHHDSRLGNAVCRYCHFLNLGSLVHEANRRIGFPLSRFIWTGEFLDSDLDDEDHKGIAITGVIVSYGVSAYLIARHNSLALRLSASLLASVIILRGVSSLFIGRAGSLDDLEFFRYNPDQRLMGLAMIALAALGLQYQQLGYDENLDVSKMFYPLFGVERAIGSSLYVLESLV